VARFLGDRYLRAGAPRPLRELRASEEARAREIPTPRVVAGAVYPAGLVYRGDLVTDYVPRSADLAGIVFGGAVDPPVSPASALRAAGRLLSTMAARGLRHPDVNARNVLLTADEEEPLAWILDLDRCVLSPDGSAVEVGSMKARLLRSLAKIAASAGGSPPDPEPLEEGLTS
jgi:3-deoxy-D-manno-octulosonic acid kinase